MSPGTQLCGARRLLSCHLAQCLHCSDEHSGAFADRRQVATRRRGDQRHRQRRQLPGRDRERQLWLVPEASGPARVEDDRQRLQLLRRHSLLQHQRLLGDRRRRHHLDAQRPQPRHPEDDKSSRRNSERRPLHSRGQSTHVRRQRRQQQAEDEVQEEGQAGSLRGSTEEARRKNQEGRAKGREAEQGTEEGPGGRAEGQDAGEARRRAPGSLQGALARLRPRCQRKGSPAAADHQGQPPEDRGRVEEAGASHCEQGGRGQMG